jgi:phosphatidylserine/phosphatidylglycerophosphate/cardiolipin synthase-like enzyme
MLRSAILASIVFIALTVPCLSDTFQSTESIVVSFLLGEGATEAIVREINSARSQILIQACSFTSKPIAQALIAARKQGIRIEAVLDSSQRSGKFISDDFVSRAGIPAYIDSEHVIANNKVFIIDRNTLITGSFDFTKAAEENAGDLMIVKGNKPLVYRFVRDFEEHKEHSGKSAILNN